MYCDPRFHLLLRSFDLDELARDPATIFGLWPDWTLAYTNEGWDQFARENGGPIAAIPGTELGAPVLAAIAAPLRRFYVDHFCQCLQTGRIWEHDYECSSAAIYRRFRMTVYPLGRSQALLVVNSRIIERPHNPAIRPPTPADDRLFQNADGVMVQCAHCRRMRRGDGSEQWNWVPQWVERPPPRTSHGLCRVCASYHYGVNGVI